MHTNSTRQGESTRPRISRQPGSFLLYALADSEIASVVNQYRLDVEIPSDTSADDLESIATLVDTQKVNLSPTTTENLHWLMLLAEEESRSISGRYTSRRVNHAEPWFVAPLPNKDSPSQRQVRSPGAMPLNCQHSRGSGFQLWSLFVRMYLRIRPRLHYRVAERSLRLFSRRGSSSQNMAPSCLQTL